MRRRVAILFNVDEGLARGVAVDALAARGVRAAARAVEAACRERGHEAFLVPAPIEPQALLERLAGLHPDVVFNLVEALSGEARLEAAVASLLELARWPYTGSPPLALAIGLDKALTRDLLHGRGVAVPAGRLLRRGDEPLDDLRFPCIVKPVREDASHGIDAESVVQDVAAARERARAVSERYAEPALVEEFVAGREFNVSILGGGETARVLPLAEIDFTGLPSGHPHLVTYAAKWIETSVEYRGTPSIAARPLAPALGARLELAALAAYRAVGGRDYGRVDMRLHPEAGPVVLEVNPNPDLSPDAGLARAAARGGIAYADLVAGIVAAALARSRPS